MKHNAEQEGISKDYERKKLGNNATSINNGYALNEFARMDQGKEEMQRNK